MKSAIAAVALGVLAMTILPVQAQTLTYKRKSVHGTSALSQRALAQHRAQRLQSSRVQHSAAARARGRQMRAAQIDRQRVGQRPRYSINSSQRPEVVARRIERNLARAQARRTPGKAQPGVRVLQRRLATDEEMRGLRGRPTPQQRAARAGRIVN